MNDPDRPVYLLGESFGAVLALAVAHDKTDLVDRLVLVNPATSYEKSIWPRLGPALAKLPDVSLTISLKSQRDRELSLFTVKLMCSTVNPGSFSRSVKSY